MSFGDRFLVAPDLAPRRRSGESFGPHGLVIDFAGGPYRFLGLSEAQERALAERFAPFVAPEDAGAAVESRLFRLPAGDFREVDVQGWHYALDLEHEPEMVRFAGLSLVGVLEWRPSLAGGLFTPLGSTALEGTHLGSAEELEAFLGAFENYFRVLVAYRLCELGGVLLHSAAVLDGGRATVFFGASDAGKTTVSRLSQASGRAVLSDDMNAVLPAGDGAPSDLGATVHQLPFAGDFGRAEARPGAYPLARLLRLEQAPENAPGHAVAPLAPAAAVAALLACSPFVNGDPFRVDRLTENLEAIVERSGASALAFRKDAGFWGILTP